MKELSATDVGDVSGGFISCGMLPGPVGWVCQAVVAIGSFSALLISTDTNAGSTTNLSDLTAP
jgi:hypothetical protein